MPVFPSGNTRTYHPQQYFKELTLQKANQRNEGLVGGWMPAVRKVIPGELGAYYEVIVFGDVLAHDRFIVQTWHRTAHIQNGAVIDRLKNRPAQKSGRREVTRRVGPKLFFVLLRALGG